MIEDAQGWAVSSWFASFFHRSRSSWRFLFVLQARGDVSGFQGKDVLFWVLAKGLYVDGAMAHSRPPAAALFHILYEVPISGGTVPRLFPRRPGWHGVLVHEHLPSDQLYAGEWDQVSFALLDSPHSVFSWWNKNQRKTISEVLSEAMGEKTMETINSLKPDGGGGAPGWLGKCLLSCRDRGTEKQTGQTGNNWEVAHTYLPHAPKPNHPRMVCRAWLWRRWMEAIGGMAA